MNLSHKWLMMVSKISFMGRSSLGKGRLYVGRACDDCLLGRGSGSWERLAESYDDAYGSGDVMLLSYYSEDEGD